MAMDYDFSAFAPIWKIQGGEGYFLYFAFFDHKSWKVEKV